VVAFGGFNGAACSRGGRAHYLGVNPLNPPLVWVEEAFIKLGILNVILPTLVTLVFSKG